MAGKLKANHRLLLLAVLLLISSAPAAQPAAVGKNLPNVILILADDMGWSDPGCYGSEIATPNLDRLAGEGIRFTQLYNTSKCFPSRACLLTGQYAQHTGYNTNWNQPMQNAITLGEMFRNAGYTTLWSGKHHSSENPVSRGFDHYSGLMDGACNYFNPGNQRDGEEKPAQKAEGRTWCIEGNVIDAYTPENRDFYTTDAFTDYALGWLSESEGTGKPFFLYLAYNAPHEPLMAWPEDIAKYRGKYRDGYGKIRKARFEKQKKQGLLTEGHPLSAPVYRNWDTLTEEEKDQEDLKMAVYAAMIDRLDQNIGRLLEKLKAMGQDDNTLILFASDNGASAGNIQRPEDTGEIGSMTRWAAFGPDWANVSNTPFRLHKGYSHEGGIRSPLIAYWPAAIKQTNSINHTPLHFIDFMPTFLDITGTTYPVQWSGSKLNPLSGSSFLPILKGEQAIQRSEPLFWEWSWGKAIRDGEWKLVSWKDKWELYNLEADPVEENDVIDRYPEKAREMKQKYLVWGEQFGIGLEGNRRADSKND